ncbi:hypothetical protein NE237_005894 [Protea cynaroides]|uniref:Uncharacterized protein n=1 Tax=Protea cynaroides TaxID=273540 RepID=A0A9Q0QUX4_9MAGN|nr:hypothetical protein NE237_005894 [Protea cynaroides]
MSSSLLFPATYCNSNYYNGENQQGALKVYLHRGLWKSLMIFFLHTKTKVVRVPVTLNGDLRNHFVENNVGFDTIINVLFISHMFLSLARLRNDFFACYGKANVDFLKHT